MSDKNKPTDAPLPKVRATRVREVEIDGKQGWEYSDGALRNEKGQLLAPHPKSEETRITSENSRELKEIARNKKYARAQAGANRALAAIRAKKWDDSTKRWVDDGPEWENPQDMDFVEAIVEAQAAQALMVGDTSSTKAAEFVFMHTGYSEKQQEQQRPAPSLADQAIVGLIQAITRKVEGTDVIDASVTDAE